MKSEPIVVTGALLGKTAVDIAAGRYHTLVVVSTGQVYRFVLQNCKVLHNSFGNDNYGQLGNGNWYVVVY